MQAPISVVTMQTGTALVLSVRGEVDLMTAPHLTEAIDTALAQPSAFSAVIIDLTDVAFLASAGMTVLLETHRRVTPKSRFAVVADGPATNRPLTLMGLDATLEIYTDLGGAVAAFTA